MLRCKSARRALDAVCVLARIAESAAVRHAISRVCATLRAATTPPKAEHRVRLCFQEGHACVTAVIRAYCGGKLSRERMLARQCLAEAVGAIQTRGVTVWDLYARGWGLNARLRHMCTLIVENAVNVDAWRKLAPSGERRHDVYVWLPRATDEWAESCGCESEEL